MNEYIKWVCVIVGICLILGVCINLLLDDEEDYTVKVEINKRISFCENKTGVWFYENMCNEFGECYDMNLDCNNELYNIKEVEYNGYANATINK